MALLKSRFGETIKPGNPISPFSEAAFGVSQGDPRGLLYKQGLKDTKTQVASAKGDIGSGFDQAISTMSGSGLGKQYDSLFNTLLSSNGLNNALQEFDVAVQTGKLEIGTGAEEAKLALNTSADAALAMLGEAMSEGLSSIKAFGEKYGAEQLINLGMSDFAMIAEETGRNILGGMQRMGVSPAVMDQAMKTWGSEFLKAGASGAADITQDAVGLHERLLDKEIGTRTGITGEMADTEKWRGAGLADVAMQEGFGKADLTMQGANANANMTAENARNALATLEGKRGFTTDMANLSAEKGMAQAQVGMQPNYLGYSSNAMGDLAPIQSTSKSTPKYNSSTGKWESGSTSPSAADRNLEQMKYIAKKKASFNPSTGKWE